MDEILDGVFNIKLNNQIYIIGDLHGDYQCLIHTLVDLIKCCSITKVFNDIEFETEFREYLEWNNNNSSIIVFCGDLIHRKRFDHVLDDECSDIFILKTLFRLKKDAMQNKGNILIISGNHEIMNIINPDEISYISTKNIEKNKEYFIKKEFINEFIENSYAWIKINNILIAHGGLCSDYLKYLEKYLNDKNLKLKGNEIINFINDKYRKYFLNLDINNLNKDKIGYDLFIDYNANKSQHNLFWCREWGYNPINCEKFNNILKIVDCNKMIISHCPQFLSQDKPKMINFECLNNDNTYNLARVDLGMSRCFEYNKEDNFFNFQNNHYNRKICVLKLDKNNKTNEFFFNEKGIISDKLTCLQYLLLKYGMTKKNWDVKNINSDWLGFNHIDVFLEKINNKFPTEEELNENEKTLIGLLYQVYMKKLKLQSIKEYKKFSNF